MMVHILVVRRAKNLGYVLRDVTGDILDRHVPVDQLKVTSVKPRNRDRNYYYVEKIVNHRGQPGSYEFLVKWQNFPESENSWEPESSFLGNDSIKKYWEAVMVSAGGDNAAGDANTSVLCRSTRKRK